MNHFNRVLEELNAHPKERQGFDVGSISELSDAERNILEKLILERLASGNEVVFEYAKSLFGERFYDALEDYKISGGPGDLKNIFIPYFQCLLRPDRRLVREVEKGILAAPVGNDMKRAALGKHLKKVSESKEYANFCKLIAENSLERSMIKTALLGIQSYQAGNAEYSLSQNLQSTMDMLLSGDSSLRKNGLSRLSGISL